MANYNAGSVSAKIELDTSEFKKALGLLKEDVAALKGEFNSIHGVNKFTEEIEKLKKQVDSLLKSSKNLKNQTKEVNKYNESVVKADKSTQLFRKNFDVIKRATYLGKQIAEFKKIETAANNTSGAIKKTVSAEKELQNQIVRLGKAIKMQNKASTGLEREKKEYEELVKVIDDYLKKVSEVAAANKKNKGTKYPDYNYSYKYGFYEQYSVENIKKAAQALNTFNRMLNSTEVNWRKLKSMADIFDPTIEEIKQASLAFNKLATQTPIEWLEMFKTMNNASQQFYAKEKLGLSTYKERIEQTSAALRKLYAQQEQYYASVGAMSWKYWRQIRNSTVQNPRDRFTGEAFPQAAFNAQTVGLQDYYANIVKVQEAMAKLNNSPNSQAFKEQLLQLAEALKKTGAEMNSFANKSYKVVTAMDVMGKGNDVAGRISRISRVLSHFSGLSQKNQKSLAGLSQQITILKDKFRVLETSYNAGKISAETYDAELTKLAEKLKVLGASAQKTVRDLNLGNQELSKTSTNARNAGRGITTFNNGVVQTAHSGRILSNTLYQIRGALLSLKMIATAMGGMAVWGFIMDIGEGIKETFSAKNEMESQLNANAKISAGGIRVFNQALDETIQKYQKVNKYALGETVSSLGVEFELTAKQMKKAMPVVAMIQSEYVRAGRTQEEAALAVKDILQGEFQRLSRETGVGKTELEQYGWNGDKTDIESLLDAVKKAGEDRNWDLFAAKATSLNDVLSITKSRFEEFGADFLQSISPLIVGAFNTILDAITGLQKGFEGLGTFGRTFTFSSLGIGGILALGTALPMVTKGMGLAEIATIGWGKSLGTAALNLNKAEVAQHGFRKALAAVISGTSAAELSETRWTKAIMGRILGVNQGILAERGYKSAIFNKNVALRNGLDLEKTHINLGKASIINLETMTTKEMGRAQKLAYLTNNISLNEAAEMSRGKAILRTATSFKVLKAAMLGVMAIGIIAWFSSIAAWADTVKKRVDMFNDYIETGKDKISDAQKLADKYQDTLSNMSESDPNYEMTKANAATAQHNLESIKAAEKLAQSIKKTSEETAQSNDLMLKRGLNSLYSENGLKHVEKYGEEYQEMKYAAYDIAKAEQERYKFEYASLQHVNEHADAMKAANISEKDRIKYITEYMVKAKEVAENWKKFNEGDLTAGAYALLGELQLMWIDLWNDKHFINFWNSVKQTWEDIKPTVYAIKDALGDLGHMLLDFFSTDGGKIVGGIALTGTVLFGLGTKLYHVLGGAKSTIDILKTMGGKLKDVAGKWKNVGDKAEEANEKMGGGKSTGGIKGGKGKGSLGGDLKAIGVNRLKSFANNALMIAEGMILITEAIVLLNAPMMALAEFGWRFKQMEPEIRKGIEGLQLIAPTVIAILIPVMALVKVMDMWGDALMEGNAIKNAAIGIAVGLGLVTEALLLLNLPLLSLGALGWVYGGIEDSVRKGTEAMKVVSDALQYLVPFIPIFIVGIAMAALAMTGIGSVIYPVVIAGIATGIGLVSLAIISLYAPLKSIEMLGSQFPNLDGVQRGAEAIKVTAEAMTSLATALAAMVVVDWAMIAHYIDQLVLNALGINLTSLTDEGGFFDQLNTFITDFNAKVTLEPIDTTKVEALKNASTGISTVGDALLAVKTAMDNLPDEFKNGGTGTPALQYNSETDTTTVTGADTSGYFDQFKEPLKQLKDFVYDFNHGEDFNIEAIDPNKIAAINSAADMIVQVQSAVDKVKQTMGLVADAGWNQNMATGGIFAAVSGYLGGLTAGTTGGAAGAEGYSSSLGSSLKEMENVIKDLVTFNSNISGLLGGASGDGSEAGGTATAMANMVTAVDQAIQNLSTTLSNAVPQIKGNAHSIGQGIHDGVKEGMGSLTELVVPPLVTAMNAMKANAYTYGKGVGDKGRQGIKETFKVKETIDSELRAALWVMDSKKQHFYNKGYQLGQAAAQGVKDGDDMHSPGIMSRTFFQEMDYIDMAFDDAIRTAPQKAYTLGETLASNFNPQLGLGGLSVEDLSAFQSGLDQVSYMANTADVQTSAAFTDMSLTANTSMNGMTTSVNGAFNNINTNATTSYARLTNTTRTSLKNMQDQTTKNIGAIKTSWRGMQTALIASAENIRSETSSKIHTLQSNMASFWRKVQNPALLLSGPSSMPSTRHTFRRGGGVSRSATGKLMAGSSPKTGISNNIRARGNSSLNLKMREKLAEYLQCLLSDGYCASGGWNFNWTPKIVNAMKGWKTHFGDIYDPYLNVAKFENDNFPVRGIKEIALNYIEDAIGRTSYEHYFNYKYGSPLAAWNAGHFNCVEGAEIAIALASAFGFGGGSLRYTTWDGEGHAYAYIPGLGNIDATAIQGGYGLTASKVHYAGSNSLIRNSAQKSSSAEGTTINIGDINVHIEGDVDNAEEKGRQIGDEINNRIMNVLRRNPSTGL